MVENFLLRSFYSRVKLIGTQNCFAKSNVLYVPVMDTELSEWEGLGRSSYANLVRIGNFTCTIELLREFVSNARSLFLIGHHRSKYLLHRHGKLVVRLSDFYPRSNEPLLSLSLYLSLSVGVKPRPTLWPFGNFNCGKYYISNSTWASKRFVNKRAPYREVVQMTIQFEHGQKLI